jgi:hypothetical protein
MNDEEKAMLVESLLMMGKRYNPSKVEGDRILAQNKANRATRDLERQARRLPVSRPTINNNDQSLIDKYNPIWEKAFAGIVPTQRNWRPLIELFREPLKPRLRLIIQGRWRGLKFANSKMVFCSFTIQETVALHSPMMVGFKNMIIRAMRGTTAAEKFSKIEQREDFILKNLERFPTPSPLPITKDLNNYTDSDFFAAAYFPRVVAFRQCTNVLAGGKQEDIDFMNQATKDYLRACQDIWIALFGGIAPGVNATNGKLAGAVTEALINPIRTVVASLRTKKGGGNSTPGNKAREDIIIDLVETDTILP